LSSSSSTITTSARLPGSSEPITVVVICGLIITETVAVA
jgi:hypothetical protein